MTKIFQPSFLFESKERAGPSGILSSAPFLIKFLALNANVAQAEMLVRNKRRSLLAGSGRCSTLGQHLAYPQTLDMAGIAHQGQTL
jgi:hypothetical protein